MSTKNSLWSDVDICCPHCEEIIAVDGVSIAVTVDNCDIVLKKDDTESYIKCENCAKEIKLVAHANIEVSK